MRFWALIFCLLTFHAMAGVGLPLRLTGAGQAPPSACPYGSSYSDGCALAPPNGAYQNSSFFTYAKQSSQGNYKCAGGATCAHPPPWNVAGVDYPVAYPTSTVLKDPAVASLPTGCTYQPTSGPNGGARVGCFTTAGYTFDGWDFSLHNCTQLYFQNSTSGPYVITNSKFQNGSNCSKADASLIQMDNGVTGTLDFEHNLVDGDALNFTTSLLGCVVANVTGTITLKYNAFVRCPARPLNNNQHGNIDAEFNYVEGYGYRSTDGHGEFIIQTWGVGTQASNLYSFNTLLQTNQSCSGCGTSAIYPTNGNGGTTTTATQIDHNTSITNKSAADGLETVEASVAEYGGNTYTNSTNDTNYTDPTGSRQCFEQNAATFTNPTTFTGNIDILDGSTVTGYGVCFGAAP